MPRKKRPRPKPLCTDRGAGRVKVELTCPDRATLRAWQTRAGLSSQQVSALLPCANSDLSEWQNGRLPGARAAQLSSLVQGLVPGVRDLHWVD